MDVSGKDPRSEKGVYFRASVWWWHPLWEYCETVAPEITRFVEYAHSNDGDGLDSEGAESLGRALLDEIESGRTAAAIRLRQMDLDALPDVPCETCGGTGLRAEPPNPGPGTLPCNACEPADSCSGKRRPWGTAYSLMGKAEGSEPEPDIAFVREFAEFLVDSGGFAIW
jgi:hypothetical protein